MLHHVYLIPGMFGFARLASYDYFGHVKRALEQRFRAAGELVDVQVVEVLPTASARKRAAKLAEVVDQTTRDDDGPIHLLGHSTGGLDARLVASPSAHLPGGAHTTRWLPRLRSVTTMNTPHYGTPLASFFATVNGQRVLYALSAFTFIGLSLGKRPLAVASVLIGVVGRGDRALGLELHAMDRAVGSLLGLVDEARGPEVRAFLNSIKEDQGAILQATPEAMDLTVAGFEDRPGVAYQSTASMAPTPSGGKWLRALKSPWRANSLALFTALHVITSKYGKRYPCARAPLEAAQGTASAGEPTEATLLRLLGAVPDLHANDGVVPLRSQLWGTLVWAGLGDHLDVLGHYRGDRSEQVPELKHHDWLTSGSDFGATHFDAQLDAIAGGMLRADRKT